MISKNIIKQALHKGFSCGRCRIYVKLLLLQAIFRANYPNCPSGTALPASLPSFAGW